MRAVTLACLLVALLCVAPAAHGATGVRLKELGRLDGWRRTRSSATGW